MLNYTQIIANITWHIRLIDNLPPEKFISKAYIGKHLDLKLNTMHNYNARKYVSVEKIDAFCEENDINKDDVYKNIVSDKCISCSKKITDKNRHSKTHNGRVIVSNLCLSCNGVKPKKVKKPKKIKAKKPKPEPVVIVIPEPKEKPYSKLSGRERAEKVFQEQQARKERTQKEINDEKHKFIEWNRI